MNELIRTSVYCGVVLSLGTYFLGSWLKKKLKWSFLYNSNIGNPKKEG